MQSLIVCATEKNGIGCEGRIPWRDAEDMKYFRSITQISDSVVVMGHATYKSIGRALPDRINVVLTRNIEVSDPSVQFRTDLHGVLEEYKKYNIFIIGGQDIYTEYLKWYTPDEIHYTLLKVDYPCDRFFPHSLVDWELYSSNIAREDEHSITKHLRLMPNHEELNYLELFNKVLREGTVRGDRTGTGTHSLFGERLVFSLKNNRIPVLTTKRVAFKTLAKELLWFISGSTDSKILEEQGVNIWKGNTSSEFLAKRGLPYEEGDLGPGYGFQWRHAGAVYEGMRADYRGKGVDQLSQLIETLRTDPYSRRILMSAWNVEDLDKMALPPCHIMYQLYVTEKNGEKYLSAQMYQRSCDSFIGCPFNITSYALLTHIIANIMGFHADSLIMVFGDYHIYNNHIEQVKQQLQRAPYAFPKLRFTRKLSDIDDVRLDDFELIGYKAHPLIKGAMNV